MRFTHSVPIVHVNVKLILIPNLSEEIAPIGADIAIILYILAL